MADSAPFFVTVVIAATAWTFTHAAERLSKTPYLKYSVEDIKADDKRSTYIKISNITRDKTYKNVNLLVTASPKDTITGGSVIPYQPAFEGDQSWTVAGRTFAFSFPAIEPGWKFDVSILHRTDDPVVIRLSTFDSQSIYAVRPSLETYLVENEMMIILIFFVTAALALVISFLYAASRSPPATPTTTLSMQITAPPVPPT